jgi:hypothetical protein
MSRRRMPFWRATGRRLGGRPSPLHLLQTLRISAFSAVASSSPQRRQVPQMFCNGLQKEFHSTPLWETLGKSPKPITPSSDSADLCVLCGSSKFTAEVAKFRRGFATGSRRSFILHHWETLGRSPKPITSASDSADLCFLCGSSKFTAEAAKFRRRFATGHGEHPARRFFSHSFTAHPFASSGVRRPKGFADP